MTVPNTTGRCGSCCSCAAPRPSGHPCRNRCDDRSGSPTESTPTAMFLHPHGTSPNHPLACGSRLPRAQVLNLHHKRVADVTHMLVDGSVTFRADAETSRSASIQLANPNGRRIGFGTGDPMDGALHMNNMIRIYLSYWAPSFTDAMGWVDRKSVV